jgi:integrase
MTMTSRQPFAKLPRGLGLRQRKRADGTWRLWWEPSAEERAGGALAVDLDASRPTWSKRRAVALRSAAAGGTARPRASGPGGRTIEALAEDYLRSSRFARLSASTQAGYRSDFARIVQRWGATHVARLTRPQIYAWYEQIEARAPTMAGKLVRALSVLMAHAELRGWRAENSNPCRGMKVAHPQKRRRHASWAEFDALISAAETMGWPNMACAVALAMFSGQRQADVIGLQIDELAEVDTPDGPVLVWDLTRQKRGNRGIVPLHIEAMGRVRNRLAATTDGQPRLLVDDVTGQPWSGDLFRARWQTLRAEAARTAPTLRSLQFRDLRRTFGILARQGGASRDDIADVLGNGVDVDDGLAGVYTPTQIDTTLRAVRAVQRPTPKARLA